MTSSDILCELKEHNSRNKRNCLRELCFFGSPHRVLVSLLARNLFFFTYRRHAQNLSCSFSPSGRERFCRRDDRQDRPDDFSRRDESSHSFPSSPKLTSLFTSFCSHQNVIILFINSFAPVPRRRKPRERTSSFVLPKKKAQRARSRWRSTVTSVSWPTSMRVKLLAPSVSFTTPVNPTRLGKSTKVRPPWIGWNKNKREVSPSPPLRRRARGKTPASTSSTLRVTSISL